MLKRIVLSADQERYLREHFPVEAACDIAEHLCISDASVRNMARVMGLKKAEGYDVRRFRNRHVRQYVHGWYKNCKNS